VNNLELFVYIKSKFGSIHFDLKVFGREKKRREKGKPKQKRR
jgi:hypothetical protein